MPHALVTPTEGVEMWKSFAAVTLITVACAAIAPTASQAHHAGGHQLEPLNSEQVREARRATRKFKDLEVARAAGYAKASECESDPKYGAMGVHYSNAELIGVGKLDIRQP